MILKDLIFHMIQEEQRFVNYNINLIHKKLHIYIICIYQISSTQELSTLQETKERKKI